MKHVASVSGGRTSMGPLIQSLLSAYGEDNCDFVFCDTGAEDKDTYRFVRDVAEHFGITITCIRLTMPKQKGVGGTYEVVSLDDIGQDYHAWKQLTSKYGNPYMPSGKFCTQQMKGNIFKKYCEDTYGKGNFNTWIGYRFEEGNRIWGKVASNALGSLGLTNHEKTQFYLDCRAAGTKHALMEYVNESDDEFMEIRDKLDKALSVIDGKNFRFMPELNNLVKNDVIQWWSDKSYDLKIESYRHNCLFCIEKPHGTIMLAIKDCQDEAKEFLSIVESSDVAKKENRKEPSEIMYRKGLSFRDLYDKAMESSREDLLDMSRIGQELAKKNPCSSGECSPFGDIFED